MPMIHIEYDKARVPESDAEMMSKAVRDIVSEETGIADVFAYAVSAPIQVATAPIEIFVRMTATKIPDRNVLTSALTERVRKWKTESGFSHPINLTLIPMDWNVVIGI